MGKPTQGQDTSQSAPPTHSGPPTPGVPEISQNHNLPSVLLTKWEIVLFCLPVKRTAFLLASAGGRRTSVCLGASVGISAGRSSPGCSFVYSGIRRLRLPSPPTTRPPERSTYLLTYSLTYAPTFLTLSTAHLFPFLPSIYASFLLSFSPTICT